MPSKCGLAKRLMKVRVVLDRVTVTEPFSELAKGEVVLYDVIIIVWF
jgi:hypothetical protein